MKISLKDILWMKKFGYRPNIETENIGWTTVTTYGVIRVPITALRATILTDAGRERRMICATPHFHWINSLVHDCEDQEARKAYEQYVTKYFSGVDANTVVCGVIRLVESIKTSAYEDGALSIITSKPKRNFIWTQYVLKIYDGVHRSSCALAFGHKHIQCRIK